MGSKAWVRSCGLWSWGQESRVLGQGWGKGGIQLIFHHFGPLWPPNSFALEALPQGVPTPKLGQNRSMLNDLALTGRKKTMFVD